MRVIDCLVLQEYRQNFDLQQIFHNAVGRFSHALQKSADLQLFIRRQVRMFSNVTVEDIP